MFKVYKVTNTINGKTYIGYTSLSIDKRWRLHQTSGSDRMPIYNALKKYGPEVFVIQEVGSYQTKAEAILVEKQLIADLKPAYNLHEGGTGGPMYGHMNGMYGKKHTEKWKSNKSEKMKGCGNPMYGRSHTQETRALLSMKAKGRTPHNKGIPMPECLKENLRKPKTEEHKQKLRKTYIVDGIIVTNARQYCADNNYNYICFTQAAKNNKPYKGHIVQRHDS